MTYEYSFLVRTGGDRQTKSIAHGDDGCSRAFRATEKSQFGKDLIGHGFTGCGINRFQTGLRGAASRLRKDAFGQGVVSRHDFTACGKTRSDRRFVSGHDFSHAVTW